MVKSLLTALLISSAASICLAQVFENINDLRVTDLKFQNSSYGLGSASEGRIIRTTNGGNYWDLIEPDFINKENLLSAFIASNGTSYIGGERGVLLKSVDQGQTWSPITIPFKLPVTSIYFSGDSVGVIALDYYDDSYLLRTNDGGASWKLLLHGTNFHDIRFINNQTGYFIAANELFKTTDSGKTWSRALIIYGTAYRDIHFISSDIGYLTTNWELYKTVNGGITWNQVNGYGYHELDDTRLQFVSEQVGYASSNGSMRKTTDGGLTWKEVVGNTSVFYSSLPFYFVNESTGFYGSISNNEILKTEDGGTKWAVIAGEPSPAIFPHHLNSFFQAKTDKLMFSVDCDTILWRSDNGGVFWHPHSAGSKVLNAVFFISQDIGFTVGNGGAIYKTYNSGRSWQEMNSPTQQDLFKVAFIDDQNGIAMGKTGVVLTTSNGGETWKNVSITLPAGNSIYSGGMVDKDKFYAIVIAESGVVTTSEGLYTSIDAGATWNQITVPTMRAFDAQFTDATIVAVTGSYGSFRQYSTTGANWVWSNVYNKNGAWLGSDTGGDAYSLHFSNGGITGFSVDSNGFLLRSIDMGKTWRIITNTSPVRFMLVRMVNDSTGFLTSQYNVGRISCDFSRQYIAGEFDELCPETTYTYAISHGSSTITVEWQVVGGTVQSQSATNISIKWATSGTRSIAAKLSGLNCKSKRTISQNISTTVLPAPTSIKGVLYTCLGEQEYEVLNPLSRTNYTWSLNGGGQFRTPFTNSNTVIKWTSLGTFNLSLSTSNYNCGVSRTDSYTVKVVNAVPAISEITGERTVCADGQLYEYRVQQSGGVQFIWSIAGGEIISNQNDRIIIKWVAPGTGKLNVKPVLGCLTGQIVSANVAIMDPETVWYADLDGDHFGNPNSSKKGCLQPIDYVANSSDCNDLDNSINPETLWYADQDGDQFGNPESSQKGCLQAVGYVANSSDCNDGDSSISPETVWFADQDGDGYGDPLISLTQCTQPIEFVLNNEDCNDSDENLTPENNCIITGLDPGEKNLSAFNIYPNPCRYSCLVNAPDDAKLMLIDAYGRTFNVTQMQAGMIDVSDFPPGVYTLGILKDNIQNNIRLIIKN